MWGVVVAVVLLVVVAGCVGADEEVPATWATSDESRAVFVRWTNDDGELSGKMRMAALDEDQVHSGSADFDGQFSDDGITLHLRQRVFDELGGQRGGSGQAPTVTGTVSDDTLALTLPEAEGSLAEVTLQPGEASDYNDAVDSLTQQATLHSEWNTATEELDQALTEAADALATGRDLVDSAEATLTDSLQEAVADLKQQLAETEGGDDRKGVSFQLNDTVWPSYESVVADAGRARRHLGYSGGMLGVSIDETPQGGIVIRRVMDNSPAEEAGVEAGEVIASIEGEELDVQPRFGDVVERLRGDPGETVTLGLKSGSQGDRELAIERAELELTGLRTADQSRDQLRSLRQRFASSSFEPPSEAATIISEAESRIETLSARAKHERAQLAALLRDADEHWAHAVEVAARVDVHPESSRDEPRRFPEP